MESMQWLVVWPDQLGHLCVLDFPGGLVWWGVDCMHESGSQDNTVGWIQSEPHSVCSVVLKDTC